MKTILFFLCLLLGAWSKETTFLIIRHGETDGNQKNLLIGWTDVPLNENGMQQAKELVPFILAHHSDVSAIYASDLSRAFCTAQPTAYALGLPIVQRMALREINWGKYEGISVQEKNELFGMYIQELHKCYPDLKERWNFPIMPGAESFGDLHQRLLEELRQIASMHPGEKVLVFSHGRAIKTLISFYLNTEDGPYPENCQITRFTLDPDDPKAALILVGVES